MDHTFIQQSKSGLLLSVVSASLIFAGSSAQACFPESGRGIAPENDLYIGTDSLAAGTMTADQFNKAIDQVEKVYAPAFQAQGRTLEVVRKWDDGTVNAYAKRAGNTSQVHMFGGLARHSKMTVDGFQLVICHEIGHHLGGAPKNAGIFGMNRWASNEGEADYFATLKCSRNIWKSDDNAAIVGNMMVPPTVTASCQKAYDAPEEILLCQRAAMAGQALADTLGDLGQKKIVTSFDTPNTKSVKKTFNAHPEAQCRLDTYFAGAVCAKPVDGALSDTDPTVGTCSSEKGDVLGIRPICWYKPLEPGEKPGKTSVWPSLR